MVQSLSIAELPSPQEVFEEGLRYFMGQGDLNQTLTQLAADLEAHGIDYLVVGAVALLAHGYPRFTFDIDLILTPEGLESFHRELIGRGYVAAFPGATKALRSTEKGIRIDVITSGGFPGDGKAKPVAFPAPAETSILIKGVRYATLEKLIELKLASGISASDRLKDLADVQELIKFRGLNSQFAERLNPYVRAEYLKLLGGIENASRNIEEKL